MSVIFDVLELETIDRNIFRGHVVPSKFKRTFGGQVAAQALVAATKTISEKAVHSLHGYFVGPGDSSQPTIFMVDRVRDGKSFSSRQVTAIQSGEPIFIMQASFHRQDDQGIEHSDRMRKVPDPEDVHMDVERIPQSSRVMLEEWSDWDIRQVPSEDFQHNPFTASQQVVWLKSKTPLPDDPTFHVCTLAYMSDMTLLHSSLVPHPHHPVQMASLDHAMWFLRPFRADEWLLYDQISPSAHAGRALTHGRIFNQQGDLVAVTTQEGLTRTLAHGKAEIPIDGLGEG